MAGYYDQECSKQRVEIVRGNILPDYADWGSPGAPTNLLELI